MPSETTENNAVVFDAGQGNFFSISGVAFTNGLFVTDKEKDKELIRNYIAQTGEVWTETAFDPANPRHTSIDLPANMQHIVVGIQTSSHVGKEENQLAKSIVDGSYGDLAGTAEGQTMIDPATILANAQAASAASAATHKNLAAALKTK
jgi:hypothetical protein